ncbi:MAG: hypothetical protein IKG18_08800 [Atopobiaceae bacterium]|nr:hypothetical protein [Atopobiaceae bacterium]
MEKAIDPESGKEVRPTDNGPKDCDMQASQSAEPLSPNEIKNLIEGLRGE